MMDKSYNDATLLMATQIAYLNFDGKDVTAGELVDATLGEYGIKVDGNWVLNPIYKNAKNSGELEKQLEVAANIEKIQKEMSGFNNWRDWKVIDVCNDQDDSGYYGMLIDTGDNQAIIANRGSESFDSKQTLKDWGEADLGLLDSSLTKQQERSQKYMDQIWYKYGDKYDSFSVTGHSLGGNLSQHMTVFAPVAMQQKIDRCVSFDGPGFSNEYIEKHRDKIKKMANKMDHFQWSFVSSLLTVLPGVNNVVIEAKDEPGKDWITGMLFRHDVHNVIMGKDGYIIKGKESDLSKILGPLSKQIDKVNESIFSSWIVLPNLPISRFFRVVSVLKMFRDACQFVNDIRQKVDEGIKNIYYNYIAPQVSGNYEIRISAVMSDKDKMAKTLRDLNNIIYEIDKIRRNMDFSSISGSYYKSQLWIIKTGFESDKNKIDKLINAAESATKQYKTIDNNVSKKFC